jgi:hypothetical protein
MYSLVISHSITSKFQYSFQQDFGYQSQATQGIDNSYWYGINQYLFYDFTETITGGIRGEWFRDNNGTRVNLGTPGNYFELTTGLNWKPLEGFSLRPEIRYDRTDRNNHIYDNQTKNQQFEVAMDVVLTF